MNTRIITFLSAICLALNSSAQEMTADIVVGNAAPPPAAGEETEKVISAPSPSTAAPQTENLTPGEQRIRAGIVILGNLYNLLAGIQDNESAEKAVAPLMRLNHELNLWAQGFTTLPPMSETEQTLCEDTYLPIIKKINYSIRTQGERIAAAEYYGSMNLPTVLVKLAILNQ